MKEDRHTIVTAEGSVLQVFLMGVTAVTVVTVFCGYFLSGGGGG
jgi:hypothetical protein